MSLIILKRKVFSQKRKNADNNYSNINSANRRLQYTGRTYHNSKHLNSLCSTNLLDRLVIRPSIMLHSNLISRKTSLMCNRFVHVESLQQCEIDCETMIDKMHKTKKIMEENIT